MLILISQMRAVKSRMPPHNDKEHEIALLLIKVSRAQRGERGSQVATAGFIDVKQITLGGTFFSH